MKVSSMLGILMLWDEWITASSSKKHTPLIRKLIADTQKSFEINGKHMAEEILTMRSTTSEIMRYVANHHVPQSCI